MLYTMQTVLTKPAVRLAPTVSKIELMSLSGPTIRDVPVSAMAEHPPAHTERLVLPLIVTLNSKLAFAQSINQAIIHTVTPHPLISNCQYVVSVRGT